MKVSACLLGRGGRQSAAPCHEPVAVDSQKPAGRPQAHRVASDARTRAHFIARARRGCTCCAGDMGSPSLEGLTPMTRAAGGALLWRSDSARAVPEQGMWMSAQCPYMHARGVAFTGRSNCLPTPLRSRRSRISGAPRFDYILRAAGNTAPPTCQLTWTGVPTCASACLTLALRQDQRQATWSDLR